MNTDMHVNTLHIYERLKKVKASEGLSREIADIIGNLVDNQIATKNDLKQSEILLQNEVIQSELRLQTEIAKSKSETIKWIIGWMTGLIIAQTGLFMAFIKIVI